MKILLAVVLALGLTACAEAAEENRSPGGQQAEPPVATPASGSPRERSAEPTSEAEIPPGHNRLALEMSPYLRQHAENPVDWYPWGPEAMEKARSEDKPIFLSIGYSTCYWCHVMEEESFEDEEVAALLNEHFVPVKVDREERPDLDEVYMTAVQILTGRGGWPMSTFLTPEGKPFFGGTYFPKDRFLELLRSVARAWQDERARLLTTADRVHGRIAARQSGSGASAQPDPEVVERAVASLGTRYDERRGGFSTRPKFPGETNILLLLDWYQHTGEERALEMALGTLEAMARGGIRDHLGGGFHRYSVDARWLVPHFEKMLYNQAWLGRAYLDAWRLTGRPLYRRVVEETLAYVLRDLRAPSGAFYSAEDAGHVGEEGAFYVWTPEEIRRVLEPGDAKLFEARYGVSEKGHFEHGTSILHIAANLEELAADGETDPAALERRLDRMRERLRRLREKRERPFRDEKILTGWNGMMIATLARAGRVLGEEDHIAAASRAAEAVLSMHRDEENDLLLRASKDGEASPVPAFQEDYAWLIDGLLELYDATGEAAWLERARHWADRMIEQFWDEEAGGFFQTGTAHERLVATPKDPYDGAVPSGNSVAAFDLVRLARRTGDPAYLSWAEQTIGAFSSRLESRPAAHTFLLVAYLGLRRGEAGPLAYGGRGTVRAEAEHGPEPGRLTARLRIRDGWHVNANPAGMEDLIPTSVSVRGIGVEISGVEPTYPAGKRVRLAFADEPLSLYEGTVTIPLAFEAARGASEVGLLHLDLRFQPCDDDRCLAPETVTLEVVPAATRRRPSR